MTEKTDAILLCGSAGNALPGSVEDVCADCGCVVVHMPSDPEVPTDATKLCVPCGMKRIADSGEVPEFQITKQNEKFLDTLGWRLKKGTIN